jgi:hypothetical protein
LIEARNEGAAALVFLGMRGSRFLQNSSFVLTALVVIGAVTLAALSAG